MKKINVFMKFPLNISDSQYYKSILDFPPKNIEYYNNIGTMGMMGERKLFFMNKVKHYIRWFLRWSSLPVPLAYKIKDAKKYDIIHCAHCLCLNKKPWVADFEYYSQFLAGAELTKIRRKILHKVLSSKYCKKILPWTESAKNRLLDEFPDLEDKIEVLPYGMEIPKFKKIKSKKVRILFTARYFFAKGGLHVLEAIDILTKKHDNVYATFISSVPEDILRKYESNKKIKFYPLLPYKKITKEIYPASDIYLYPGYSDSYGFPFVEAQAFGIPVVTVDGASRRELIEDGKTGFVIDRPEKIDEKSLDFNRETIKQMVKATERLIKDKKLIDKMGREGMRRVKSGRFSMKVRNNILKKIYSEALE